MKEYQLDGTKTQYLEFLIVAKTDKTVTFSIYSRRQEEEIGRIKWFGRWRQYCFFPNSDTVWNRDCLNDLIIFINHLMELRK